MLNKRSLDNLEGVHADLRAVVIRADKYTETPFLVIEGVRTLARQKALFAAGASKTMRSRHLTGHAIDFVPLISNKIEWKTTAFLKPLEAFRKAAKELKIDVEFGADWKTFEDFPHVQLSWKAYP
jgi:peptidoglycan L-alanyl-D-glutamate endopeptidase CwlK